MSKLHLTNEQARKYFGLSKTGLKEAKKRVKCPQIWPENGRHTNTPHVFDFAPMYLKNARTYGARGSYTDAEILEEIGRPVVEQMHLADKATLAVNLLSLRGIVQGLSRELGELQVNADNVARHLDFLLEQK